jgi:hypothetical protein
MLVVGVFKDYNAGQGVVLVLSLKQERFFVKIVNKYG